MLSHYSIIQDIAECQHQRREKTQDTSKSVGI